MNNTNPMADEMRAWRKRLQFTQSSAASALGIPFRTYQHWEDNSMRGPAHPAILRMAMDWIERRLVLEWPTGRPATRVATPPD